MIRRHEREPNVSVNLARTAHSVAFWLPMSFTISRLIIAPLLPFQIHAHILGNLFPALFIAGFAADIADGWLARKLNVVSRLGSIIDSAADALFWVCTATALWLYNAQLAPWFTPLLLVSALTTLACWLFAFMKYQRFASYHSLLAKCTAVALFIGVACYLFWGMSALLLVALLMLVAGNIENALMTATLPVYTCDVKTLEQAIAARRMQLRG